MLGTPVTTPAMAKAAVAGDPGYHPSNGKSSRRRGPRFAQEDTSYEFFSSLPWLLLGCNASKGTDAEDTLTADGRT
jgi:hypothetical protein